MNFIYFKQNNIIHLCIVFFKYLFIGSACNLRLLTEASEKQG